MRFNRPPNPPEPAFIQPEPGSCFVSQVDFIKLSHDFIPLPSAIDQLIKYDRSYIDKNGPKYIYEWFRDRAGLPKGTNVGLPIWLCPHCVLEISRQMAPNDPERERSPPKLPNYWLLDPANPPALYEFKPLSSIQTRYSASEIYTFSNQIKNAALRFQSSVDLIDPSEPTTLEIVRAFTQNFFELASSEPLSPWASQWIAPPQMKLILGDEKVPAKLQEVEKFSDLALVLIEPIVDRFSAYARGIKKDTDYTEDNCRPVDLMDTSKSDELEREIMLSARLSHILLLGLAQLLKETPARNPSRDARYKIASILTALKICFLGFEVIQGNITGLAAVLLSCSWAPDILIFCATEHVSQAAACCEILLIITEIIKVFDLHELEYSLMEPIKARKDKLLNLINELDVQGNKTDNLARIVVPLASMLCQLNSSSHSFDSRDIFLAFIKQAFRILTTTKEPEAPLAVMTSILPSRVERFSGNRPNADVVLPKVLDLLSISYTSDKSLKDDNYFMRLQKTARDYLAHLKVVERLRQEKQNKRSLTWRLRIPHVLHDPHQSPNVAWKDYREPPSLSDFTVFSTALDYIDNSPIITCFKPSAGLPSITSWSSPQLRHFVDKKLAEPVAEHLLSLDNEDIESLATQIIGEFNFQKHSSHTRYSSTPDPTRITKDHPTTVIEDAVECLFRTIETFDRPLEPRYLVFDPLDPSKSSTPLTRDRTHLPPKPKQKPPPTGVIPPIPSRPIPQVPVGSIRGNPNSTFPAAVKNNHQADIKYTTPYEDIYITFPNSSPKRQPSKIAISTEESSRGLGLNGSSYTDLRDTERQRPKKPVDQIINGGYDGPVTTRKIESGRVVRDEKPPRSGGPPILEDKKKGLLSFFRRKG